MVVNKDKHVKFISYTGKYPNLCSGILTLEIDGSPWVFGCGESNTSFWTSGGRTWFDDEWGDHTEANEWIIDARDLPEEIRCYADEIDEVFNCNVEYGCCGGCI